MIVLVMGVSGSGKSTVGAQLAQALGCGFSDADSFHSPANVAKMRAGIPLQDEDRWPWLAAVRAAMDACRARGEDHVFACSALKARYREQLGFDLPDMHCVYLSGSPELIASRLAARSQHFFDPALLASQFAALEAPAGALQLDIAEAPEQLVARIQAALQA